MASLSASHLLPLSPNLMMIKMTILVMLMKQIFIATLRNLVKRNIKKVELKSIFLQSRFKIILSVSGPKTDNF